MRRRIIIWILAGLVVVGVGWQVVGRRSADTLTAQQERSIAIRDWRYREVCPPGHRTELVIGEARLAVDMKVLDAISLKETQEVPEGCPTEPLRVDRVLLDDITPELAALYRQHELRLTRLVLEDPAGRFNGPKNIPTAPDRRLVVDGVGAIEDITAVTPPPVMVLGRIYRLELVSAASGENSPPIEMFCSGDPQNGVPKGRSCHTTYVIDGDLLVEYEFSQDRRTSPEDHWDLSPEGPIKEPDDLILVDTRVRHLINELRIR